MFNIRTGNIDQFVIIQCFKNRGFIGKTQTRFWMTNKHKAVNSLLHGPLRLGSTGEALPPFRVLNTRLPTCIMLRVFKHVFKFSLAPDYSDTHNHSQGNTAIKLKIFFPRIFLHIFT